MTLAIVAGFVVVAGVALGVQAWAGSELHRIRRARYRRG